MLSNNTNIETLEVTVTGKVQGVGFRTATVRHAHLYKVNGWVRNAPDGSVELLLQGPIDNIDLLLSWLHKGPENAVVQNVHSQRSFEDKHYKHFQLR
ncbi:acylphosphatase [Paenalcaligenes niemegkensis]|uniref:acylphosphatase n=1 Tax=Paenalcaligenes niemegkensis TaxID=2895469 RepID=UPI001EE78D12|nr:acylphosphatase [Paenalcaligenes niemegkensis]MCQ9617638.1 acylphosphatase [Paenalcaligenes niemegkensis]